MLSETATPLFINKKQNTASRKFMSSARENKRLILAVGT